MGSGRDKRKKAKGAQPGKGAAKTEQKTHKNQEKAQRRAEKATKGGEDDIDALLATFALQDAASTTATVLRDVAPPCARTYASFIPGLAQDASQLYLFGGEWYDGPTDKMYVYADLYIYRTEKDKWDKIVAPKGPSPRSSHQAVMLRGFMYVFGGEFTSPNQEKFKTYSDLWRLELGGWQWEQLPSRGGPSARCGHRMAVAQNKILLFGGFYDTGAEQRFYNDLWEYDVSTYKWTPLGNPLGPRPSPRGGCQLAVQGSLLFLFGGYTAKLGGVPGKDPAPGTSGAPADDDDEGGVAHDDVWLWDTGEAAWRRVKKVGMVPQPRSSFGMVTHKNRAIMFGGVTDKEGKGDRLYSELFNDLYQFNCDTRRWYPLALRPPKAKNTKGPETGTSAAPATPAQDTKAQGQSQLCEQRTPRPCHSDATSGGAVWDPSNTAANEGEGGEGGHTAFVQALEQHAKDPTSAFQKAAVRIQANFRGFVIRKAYKTYKLGGPMSELLYSPATYGVDLSSRDIPKPRSRAAPMMAVVKNTMYMFGGIVEIESTDVPLDDLWTLDLIKLEGWRCLKENTGGEEAFKHRVDSEESETDADALL